MLAGYSQEVAMQVLASAGGYFENTGAGLSLTWTVGEPAYTTLTSQGIILTQGFQQGNLLGNKVDELVASVSGIRIYPNPVSGEVNIAVALASTKGQATFEIYDITGRMVKGMVVAVSGQEPYKLDVSNLPSGIYLLKVTIEKPYTTRVVKLVKK